MIDQAFERFKQIVSDLPPEDDRPLNEANTRLKLIDPILTDVLGWSRNSDLWVELQMGESRIDYLLKDSSGTNWFLVEAKRRTVRLVDPAGSADGRRFKISGPVLSRWAWPIVRDQMATYIGQHMPAFGVVTNGEQWIGYLGKLLPDGCSIEDAQAVVFRSLADIEGSFERF
jgi:hypothetical protein